MSNADSVIDRAMQFVNEKQPYCFGGKNQPMNKSNKKRVEDLKYEHYTKPLNDNDPKTGPKSKFDHILGNEKTNSGMNYKQYINASSSPYVLIDCSGLTNVSFKAAGFDVSHGSSGQQSTGDKKVKAGKATKVDPKTNPKGVQPGALLWRNGHVAVAGNNQKVIEAKGWKYGCVAGVSKVGDFTAAYNFKQISGDSSSSGGGTPDPTPGHELGPKPANAIGTATIKVSKFLNVRAAANTSSEILGELHNGDQVYVTGDCGKFYEIYYNNRPAYIWKDYAKFTASTNCGSPQPPSHGSDAPVTSGAGQVKVTANDLNVRTDSNTDASKIGMLHKNDVVEYTGMKDGWYQIKYQGKVGYISGKYAKVVSEAGNSGSAGSVRVTAHNLNVRTDSNTDANKIGQLHKNDVVGYSGMKNGWYQIDYKGQVGFICGEYAKVV